MPSRIVPLIAAVALAVPALADEAADIEARTVAFETAFNGGDAAATGALYTDDAILLPPGGPVIEGRDGIVALWQGAIDSGLKDLDLMTMNVEVAGDTAYETGTFEGTVAGADGETPANGKYVVVWKKVDGNWMLHRDIWNDMPAE